MYLRSLELIGFKSFADKTRLEFEPGMTCIVGPNGCGKSNIADAVRWVIGEQSAKALRGAKMQDCIFSGTDARKPLGMAEVSITFAGCEEILKTEYDEVTVTRRVFRSGEGQYFINKTPCRLKDIQRLFMDTGVGTTSYSLMEQGRIDRVLSSRPEDRRTVFEEASGITKFKADKKEAIRKLEHTEANLLRLADVIREVKRQIGSLQRQAGKARRYKTIQGELRSLDIYLTRERVKEMDVRMSSIDSEMGKLTRKTDEIHDRIKIFEEQAAKIREQLARTEQETAEALEAGVQAKSKLDHTRDLIATNRQRITEYQGWKDRDSREIDQNQKLIDEHEKSVEVLAQKLSSVQTQHDEAEKELKEANENFARHQQSIDNARSNVQTLREESVELESLTAKLQNQLVEIESRDRSAVLQRERLAAEKAQLGRASASFEKRQADMTQSLDEMKARTATSEEALDQVQSKLTEKTERIRERRQAHSDLRSEAAAKNAQVALLEETEAAHEGSPEGTRLLLDETNPLNVERSHIMGVLAQHIDVEENFRKPLEAVLDARLESVLVKDQAAAMDVLRSLEAWHEGSASLQVAAMEPPGLPPPPQGMERLLDHVKFAPEMSGLASKLLAH
ncbi:MAG: AAA family ATPase, partial [Kiritimatiellia bacterium]|nr:AAA family ATPase [Kiritimatiellia bacterium]